MFEVLAGQLLPLLQATSVAVPASGLPDTLVMRQVDPGWFERVTTVASGLMSIALLALAIAMVPAAWNFRKTYKRWNELLEKTAGDVRPLMHHAASVADNLDYITTALRADVHRVNATVNDANERLQDAVRAMEQRVQAFTALLDVAQQETERAFISTAATVRGVRTGAAVLRDRLADTLDDADDIAHDAGAIAALDARFAEGLLPPTTDEDPIHGHDDHPDEPGPARPRVRPRGRR